ncbi:MAG: hypothetical protein FWB71_04190 [Defluviitaleaceae bacterium]|nr:hypothetical protein [Defluviitaleaceae bacterium]
MATWFWNDVLWMSAGILGGLAITAILIVLIITAGRVYRARSTAFNSRKFEALAAELREENATMRAELIIIREYLANINKMMTEVQ